MPWYWNPETKQYYNDEGRILSRQEELDYMQASIDAAREAPLITLSDGTTSIGTDLLASLVANPPQFRQIGFVSTSDWIRLMREQIKREYDRLYMLGRGGRGSMTSVDYGSIGGMLAEQYRWLDDFAELIAEGKLSEAQIRARSAMYVHSAREAFERAKARAFGIPDNELPEMPARGGTRCLTNCNCDWVHEEVYDEDRILIGWNSTWTLGAVKTDHCPDCEKNAGDWNPFEIRL